MTSNKKQRKYGDIVNRALPDSSQLVSQVFDRLIGRTETAAQSTSINLREEVKSDDALELVQDINSSDLAQLDENINPEEKLSAIREFAPTASHSPYTSITMIEDIKSVEALNLRESIKMMSTSEMRADSRIEAGQIKRSDEISRSDQKIGSDQLNTSLNLRAPLIEEPPPLSMSADIEMSAPIKMREVLTVPATKGETSIPNEILDGLLPLLDPTASLVYLRLYRLSWGFKTDRCTVGMGKLASSVNIGTATAERAIKKLESLGLIERLGSNFGHGIKGNHYLIRKPATSTNLREDIKKREALTERDALKTSAPPTMMPNKDHDHDDLIKHDHHQRETMRIYQSITGNNWIRSDQTAYEKIQSISLEIIEQGIKVATARAASRPGSLAYFVKEITQLANPTSGARAQRRRELQAIINRVKSAQVGRTGYTMAEFSADVKDACAREGIIFDHQLFNELIN